MNIYIEIPMAENNLSIAVKSEQVTPADRFTTARGGYLFLGYVLSLLNHRFIFPSVYAQVKVEFEALPCISPPFCGR